MKKHGEAFVGIDTAKTRNAVAIAEIGRRGEIRYLGEYDTTPDAVAKLVRRLADRYEVLHFCYEAGPTGYGLYRQILALGHNCTVVAPSMIPRKPGERVKTNRRDAQSLARMHRAGELTAVWVPDAGARPGARTLRGGRGLPPQTPASQLVSPTAWPELCQEHDMERSASTLVECAEFYPSGAAAGLPGKLECRVHRC